MKLVVVKFQDPTTFHQWTEMDEIDKSKCKICYAGGFLVEENDDITKVALLYAEDKGSASNWIAIPTACVLACEVIKEVDWEAENEKTN